MDLNLHDVEAAADVFVTLGELSDSLSMEDAIAYKEALGFAKSKLEAALSLVNTQIVRTLDSPVQVGKRIWYLADDGKWRPDHSKVRQLVVDEVSRPDANGEVPTARDAAIAAFELARQLYVMPGTMPKKAGLDRLGVARKTVAHWEKTGSKIETKDLEGPDE